MTDCRELLPRANSEDLVPKKEGSELPRKLRRRRRLRLRRQQLRLRPARRRSSSCFWACHDGTNQDSRRRPLLCFLGDVRRDPFHTNKITRGHYNFTSSKHCVPIFLVILAVRKNEVQVSYLSFYKSPTQDSSSKEKFLVRPEAQQN